MPIATFYDLCLDASSADRMTPFWAAVLGVEDRRPDGRHVLTVAGTDVKVWANEVPESNDAKNRVHLDVHCASVDELIALGAVVDRGPNDKETWWSMWSPDGDEFCAFVRTEVPANRLYEIVVDCADAAAQARWWGQVFGVPAKHEGDAWLLAEVPGLPCDFLVFQPVPEPKIVKNRAHWDVKADVDAVLAEGATLLRGPTPEDAWHVLADPEGNEFCVFA